MVSFSLFLFLFLIFIKGVSSSTYAGDSGDVILASWFGGVAHPPGYPLNTMIGWVFTHLPFTGTVAFKANLMAAFLQALTGVFIFQIARILTKKNLVSLTVALLFAFNPLIWLYAHIIEVFQLNLLLISISIYFLFRWGEQVSKRPIIFLYFAAFFIGLGVFHHQTSVLLAPAFIYYVFATDKSIFRTKIFLKLLGVFLLGFIPYFYIPFAAFRATPVNWDNPVNLTNFIRLISRADYGSFQASTFIIGDSISRRMIQLANYFLFVKSDFSVIGSALISVGLIFTFLIKRKYFYFLILAVFFTGPFFFFYGSFPLVNDFYIGLWERFLLLSYLFLVICAGFGLNFIVGRVEALLKELNFGVLRGSGKKLLANSFILLLPLAMFFLNFSKTNLADFHLGDWLAYDTLSSAEKGSIIFLVGDTAVFNTQYVYYTDPSVRNYKLIRMGSLNKLEYRQQLVRDYKDIIFPGNFLQSNSNESISYITDLIEKNHDLFGIYSADFIPNVEDYYWMQSGLLKKLVKKEHVTRDMLVSSNERAFNAFKFKDFGIKSYTHYLETHLRDNYYDSFNSAAKELYANKEEGIAVKYLNNAIKILPERKEAYINLASVFYRKNDCNNSEALLLKARNIDPKDFNISLALADIYGTCLNNQQKSDFFKNEADQIRKRFYEKPL